jgi:hypothetical protein
MMGLGISEKDTAIWNDVDSEVPGWDDEGLTFGRALREIPVTLSPFSCIVSAVRHAAVFCATVHFSAPRLP